MTGVERAEVESVATAVVRATVTVADLPDFLPKALGTVARVVEASWLSLTGPPFCFFHEVPRGGPQQMIDVEAGFPVDGTFTADGDLTPSVLPGGAVVTALHEGPYETLGESYAAVSAWIESHGLHPDAQAWEVYLDDDPAAGRGTWVVRLVWPVTSAP